MGNDESVIPQFAFVHTLGTVEVIGRTSDGLVVVRLKGTTKEHLVRDAEVAPLDCDAAKKARMQQLRAAQFRRRKPT
jgi:hypothetical protein